MIDPLSFSELRRANVARCEEVFHPLDSWSPTDWATALAGEVGEACNFVKKLRRLDRADSELDTELNRERLRCEIGKELADAIIYADLLAARLGIDLGSAVRDKFNLVSGRRGSTIYLAAAQPKEEGRAHSRVSIPGSAAGYFEDGSVEVAAAQPEEESV